MQDQKKRCPYCGGPIEMAVATGCHDQAPAKCDQCGNIFHHQSSRQTLIAKEPKKRKADDKPVNELVEEARKLSLAGRHKGAVIKLRAAADREPRPEAILMSLGLACSKANLSYDALAAYKRAIDINQSNQEALFKASVILVAQKKYSHAIGLLNQMIDINPGAEQAKLMIRIAKSKAKEDVLPSPLSKDKTKSKRRERLYQLFKLIKNRDTVTTLFVSVWLILPIFFGIVYGVQVNQSGSLTPVLVAILIYTLFMGVVLHELGHGGAAFLSGDDTAFRAGRLTLNPIRHISFLGTVIVPITVYSLTGVTFGWAKPVPFNPHRLERQPRDQALVAGAGPFVSFTLSYMMFILFLSFASIHNGLYPGSHIYFSLDLARPMDVGPGLFAPVWFVCLEILAIGSVVNLVLGVFNLIPVPPLDGSWLFKAAAPPRFAILLDRSRWLGLAIIIAAVYSGWIVYLFYPAFMILAGYDFLSRAIL